MRLFYIAALALSQASVVLCQQVRAFYIPSTCGNGPCPAVPSTCAELAKQKHMPTDGWTVVHDDEGQAFCRRVEIKELCLGVEHIDADTKEKRCCPDVSGLTWIDKPAQLAKCCAKGHVWTYDHGVGSAHGGCCPVGFHMSNGMCIPNITPPPPPHRCPTGTHLVDGQCVQIHGPCPQTCGNGLGGVEPSCTCTNNPVCGHGKYLGIKYGHCYILSFSDGHQLGIDRDSIWYKKDGFFVDIPFKVCNSTTDCSRGKEVEMGQSFSLQDQHGLYKDTKSTKGWINTPLKDGNHMEFTTDANTAAKFTGIPSCAGGECAIKMFGINGGAVSYACPMPDPGLTFYGNPKVGQKIRFSEVTCDEYEVPLTSGINLK